MTFVMVPRNTTLWLNSQSVETSVNISTLSVLLWFCLEVAWACGFVTWSLMYFQMSGGQSRYIQCSKWLQVSQLLENCRYRLPISSAFISICVGYKVLTHVSFTSVSWDLLKLGMDTEEERLQLMHAGVFVHKWSFHDSNSSSIILHICNGVSW